jgi:TRAP-type mannitol/chloroaromatic compound transport system permease large subunit/TRAP-type mannitol/chloroaromatic compound transport system permease small subunit
MANDADIGELDITDELIAERRAEAPGETPEDMTPWQRPITAFIDVLNNWAGKILCVMLIPLIFAMVFEVVSRSAFGMLAANGMVETARAWGLGPTLWVYDISRMSGGILFMGAAGYALLRGVHIRADFLFRNWTPKTQATVDAILYLLFYFPAMLFFFWSALDFTLDAMGWRGWDKPWGRWEEASDSTWAPILWPARIFMPIGAFLLFLQGFPELFRAFHQMGKSREAKFVKLLIPYFIILAIIFYLVFFQKDLAKDAARALKKGEATFLQDIVLWIQGGLDWIAGLFGEVKVAKPTIGLYMLAAMLFSIFVGFPISFTLIFLGFVFGTWGTNSDLTFYLLTLQTNSTMLDDQLVAVPLFIFMGIMMEQAGLMERLFNAVQMMMSRTKGALFVAVLFVSTIFAAATGIVGASVTILGIMAARTMNRSGYDVRMAAGTITAGGTLGILIPPSIMLIVMGPVLEVPVTDLFRAAIVPGVMLAGLYMLYAIGRCWINPSLGPILPPEEQPNTSPYYWLEIILVMTALAIFIQLCVLGAGGSLAFFPFGGLIIPILWIVAMFAVFMFMRAAKPGGFYFADLWYEFFMGLVPPTILISFALGSILLGWATPAEAAACGAFGSIFLSILYGKFSFYIRGADMKVLLGSVIAYVVFALLAHQALEVPVKVILYGAPLAIFLMFILMKNAGDALIKTLEITVLIMFLVAASNFFGAVFSNLGTPKMLTELLLSLDLGPVLTLMLIMALIFLLGWPLEWVPIVLIIVPILMPVVETLGPAFGLERVDLLVWFAILVAVNLQTAWLSPPVALSAYFLKGVVPEWDLKDIYLGMMQFMVIQVIGLIMIFVFPEIALWLPRYLDGGG